MAQTTQRIIELVVKLQGAKSLEELEKVTEEINDELKQVGENAEAFEDLAKLANDAVAQVKKVDDELSQVTAQEKTEAIRKVGEGLVGAFQVAAGASLFFGKKTSEELEKVIAKVGGLFNMVDGLDKVSKVFAANNIKALKATVKGFQESAIAAKLFGTTTKAALTATGIGVLVVILGTIIANFQKIKEAAAKAFDSMRNAFPVIDKIGNLVDNLKEKFGTLGNFVKGVGAAMEKLFQLKFREIADAFNAAVEEGKQLNAVVDEYQSKILDTQQAHENRIKLLQTQGGKEQEILNLEKERNKEIVDLLTKKEKLGTLSEKEKEALEEAKFQLQLLNIEQDKLNKKRQEERDKAEKERQDKAAQDAKDAIAAAEKAAQDAADKKAADEAARTAEKALYFQKLDNDLKAENLEIQKWIDNTTESEFTKKERIQQLENKKLASQKKLNFVAKEYAELTDTEKQQQKGVDLYAEMLGYAEEVQDATAGIRKEQEGITEATDDITDAEKEWQKILKEIAFWMGQANELAMAAFDLAIMNAEREAELEQEKLDEKFERDKEDLERRQEMEQEAADKKIELAKETQEEINDSINDLNEELNDAEGERYDEIQAQIEAQKQAAIDAEMAAAQANADKEKLIAQQKLEAKALDDKLAADKAATEKKARKLQKQQAIVSTIMNTAMAVMNAIATGQPIWVGIALAAVAAATGAIQLAQIKKQPEYASGGYTKDGAVNEPAGIVHAGEYVVPQRVLRNPMAQAMVESLEGMRLRGYADGGTVTTTTPTIPDTSNMIDYARFGNEVARALKDNPMFVSWTEWKEMDNKVRFLQSRAGIGK